MLDLKLLKQHLQNRRPSLIEQIQEGYGGPKKEAVSKEDRKPKSSDKTRKTEEEKKEMLKAKGAKTVTKKPESSDKPKTKQSVMGKAAEKLRNQRQGRSGRGAFAGGKIQTKDK